MSIEPLKLQTANIEPGLTDEISLKTEINYLSTRDNIGRDDLFSARMKDNPELPTRPGVRVELDTPIEIADSTRSDVLQNLMAVVSLGGDVAIGVVNARNQAGDEVNYLSLMSSTKAVSSNNPDRHAARAKLIDVLEEGKPLTIGRSKLEQVLGSEGAGSSPVPAVSTKHCTIMLENGILTVIDEASLNGTSVFTNKSKFEHEYFERIQSWCQQSTETEKLIEASKEAKRLSRIAQLGKFSADNGVE